MASHFLLLVLFAFFVSLVFAVIAKDEAREQVRFGGLMFAGFLASAIVLGWLMYPFPLWADMAFDNLLVERDGAIAVRHHQSSQGAERAQFADASTNCGASSSN